MMPPTHAMIEHVQSTAGARPRRQGRAARAWARMMRKARGVDPARLATLLGDVPGIAAYVDREGRLRALSRDAARWVGCDPAVVAGRPAQAVLSPGLIAACEHPMRRALRGERVVLPRAGAFGPGDPILEEVTFVPDRDAAGHVHGVLIFGRDVTSRVRSAEVLARERERALVTLESIADAVITVDWNGQVTYLNPVAQSLTGWDADAALGRPCREVMLLGDENRFEAIDSPVDRCLKTGEPFSVAGETILCRRDGGIHAVDLTASPLVDGDGSSSGAVIVFRDVGVARQMSQELTWQASHDALTGLPNRRHFEHCAEAAIESARHGERHALLYIDLDQFKVVNDTCGHAAGDRLLKEVAVLLSQRVRNADVLARLGGDEFGVLLRNCRVDQAMRLAERMRGDLECFRFVGDGRSFAIAASIGVVGIDETSDSLVDAMRAADAACYLAKDAGRNRVHRFRAGDREVERRRDEMEWVGRVRAALDEARFVLHGQVIQPLCPGEGCHFEVLVRMTDEKGGIVAPMAWIPAAERYGLMPRLDRWVIREALRHVGRCNRAAEAGGETPPSCAINLSGATVSEPGLLDYIVAALAENGVRPGQVCFEITETAVIANLGAAQALMAALRALGVRFALDDFGAGMSSFGHLKALAVDFLKIDGAFVRRIAEDPVDLAMVEAINNLGHVMGIRTIAEFVESDAVLAHLRRLGVDYAQGYAIAPPLPLGLSGTPACGTTTLCTRLCPGSSPARRPAH